eukprot:Seg1037.3 transcript_id=Seg1037.3/GoldUCD/mRNA.D3Y31 product="Rap guanine nucleotide exchange factor 1" protein_id=Seg1037.3/GoldUCD/D3Y31
MAATVDGNNKTNSDNKPNFVKTLDPHINRMQGLLKKIKKSTLARPKTILIKEDKHVASPVNSKTPTTTTKKVNIETDEEKLSRYQKDIKSALQYYKVIFEKGFYEKLPGTATVVLESIVSIETIFNVCLHYSKLANENVDDLAPSRETLHRNVTNLIRLSDDVLFDSGSNCQPDRNAAFRAIDSVLQSLNDLCESILPRIQKLLVNEELKSYCRSSSTHSSSNSLDDLLDSQDEGTPGRKSRKSSNSSNKQYAVNGTASNSDRHRDSVERPRSNERDSGIASEMSNSNLAAESKGDVPAPAKPPLPRKEDRSYYGNSPFPGQSMRKTSSNPTTLETPFSPVHLRPRPSSDVRPNASSGQFLEVNRSTISSSTSISSLNSSKSSFSSVEDPAVISPRRKYLLRNSRKFDFSFNSNDSIAEHIDLDEVGMSDETFCQIQKYSERYEVLAASSMSLFSNENDEESIFGPATDERSPTDLLPPVPPKQKNRAALENYFKYFDIDKYGKPSKGVRPTSYYDNVNCPVPSANDIDGDQLIRDFASIEEPPLLPPKKGTYRRKTVGGKAGRSSSPKLRNDKLSTRSFKAESRGVRQEVRRRDSTAAYEEDNVPALDCLDPSKFLISKDDRNGPLLVGGTIDGLIVYATNAEAKHKIFYEAFLATYRTFMSPVDLICKLLYRANRFRDRGSLNIAHGALSLLVRVIDEMYEELDKSLFDQLRAEVHRLLNLGELEIAKLLRDKIVNYCLKLQEKMLPKPPVTIEVGSKYSLLDFHSLDLAQHMTMMDSDLFMKIGLAEILAWGKEQNESVSPNLAEFIDHFNKMSYWCRTLILRELKQQEREKMFRKFLKIMKHCRRLSNFSSYLAILSALDCSPLRRLEFPKPLTDILQEYCQLIDSTSAFKTYRQALSEAQSPCIPYLGLILQDITFIHLGNVNELPDGKVNFVKCWQQYNVLDTVKRFKECQFEFPKNEKIIDFFNGYDDHLSEDELWDKSQEIKPRGSKKS